MRNVFCALGEPFVSPETKAVKSRASLFVQSPNKTPGFELASDLATKQTDFAMARSADVAKTEFVVVVVAVVAVVTKANGVGLK